MAKVDWEKFVFPKNCPLAEQEKEELMRLVLRATYGYPTHQCYRARNQICANSVYDADLKKLVEVLPFEECEAHCRKCLENHYNKK